jgi:hypothetical protein
VKPEFTAETQRTLISQRTARTVVDLIYIPLQSRKEPSVDWIRIRKDSRLKKT